MLRGLASRGAAAASAVAASRACSAASAEAPTSFYAFSGKRLDGSMLSLASLAGKPTVVVNVASR